jgi:hypothetical protein
MRSFGLIAALAALGPVARAGEDAVTFKLSQPKPGDRVRVTQSDKTKRTRTTEVKGKKTVAADQHSTAWVYVGEVVAPEKDEPEKIKRTYQKYEVLAGVMREPGPPLNVPITIERKDGMLAVSAGTRRLPAAFVARLEAELSPGAQGVTPVDMLPAGPVKPGESWKIDAGKAFQGTGKLLLDADHGTMTGKLVKTYKKDNRQFATLEFHATAPIKSLGPDSTLTPGEGSVAELKLTVDACIDGSDPFSRTTSRATFRVEAAADGGSVVLATETVRSETIERLPGK